MISDTPPKTLCVCLLTYNRMGYAKITMKGIYDNLIVPDNMQLRLHIADDGSPDGYLETLLEYIEELFEGRNIGEVTTTNSLQQGYGANYNLAQEYTHDYEYILPLEDDWELVRPLNTAPLIYLLDSYGAVRLGYLGFTAPMRATILHGGYLLLDPNSPEQHVFAGHPRLESRDYQQRVGPWPIGLKPGETELAVAGRKEARTGIIWPMDLIQTTGNLFCHIGTVRSYD